MLPAFKAGSIFYCNWAANRRGARRKNALLPRAARHRGECQFATCR
jgi:hypothetical protein